jgi:hypothetical protein
MLLWKLLNTDQVQTPNDDFHMMLPMFDEWKISEHDLPMCL